jgi:large subunit ribosomal protein L31
MKKKIHPKWHPKAKITCACGHTIIVGSTKPELRVEVCAHCHPLFTGKMKFIDTLGRVEKFQAQRKAAQTQKAKTKKRKQQQDKQQPKTLKEMLQKN